MPGCAQLEATMGDQIEQLAEAGKVNLVWRPATFLDPHFASVSPNPNSSQRAAAAWGCAIDAGKSAEYHKTVFANQPATEGDGWTDEQLLEFGKQAGLTGEAYTTFETCFNDKTYAAVGRELAERVHRQRRPRHADGVPQRHRGPRRHAARHRGAGEADHRGHRQVIPAGYGVVVVRSAHR